MTGDRTAQGDGAVRYDIGLTIESAYAAATTGTARNLVRILPRAIPGRQTLLSGHVELRPLPDERADRADFFGNAVTEVAHRAGLDAMTVMLRARVERVAAPAPPDLSPPWDALGDELARLADLGAGSPLHFRAPSPRVAALPAVAAFARAALPGGPPPSVLGAVRAVGLALHREMRFQAGATDVDTPPDAAFAARAGVCQDFTHVMIAGLRGLGIPAGYVSGFLRTTPPPGRPRMEGADAMHAWVRAWCGARMGWVEYDPTNDLLVGTDHVVVAWGRDYSDVAPVRGVLRTSGAQTSRHVVDVVPLDD